MPWIVSNLLKNGPGTASSNPAMTSRRLSRTLSAGHSERLERPPARVPMLCGLVTGGFSTYINTNEITTAEIAAAIANVRSSSSSEPIHRTAPSHCNNEH
jgi:hypothetical protein